MRSYVYAPEGNLLAVRRAITAGIIDAEVAFNAACAWEAMWRLGTGTFTREVAAFWLRLALELEAVA